MTHRSHEGITYTRVNVDGTGYHVIGSYISYKACINLPFGDSAMYFDHGVKGKLNLISCD